MVEEHPLLKEKVEWKINYTLDRIKKVCSFMGDPQNDVPSILIGGTNGKGTVARALAEILRRSGKKTGCFISPHLERITERISINGKEINEDELKWALDRVAEAKYSAGVELTYFEILTSSAFLIFSRHHLDFAILEVGMGGRLDATNISAPLLSVIVSVGHDHEEFLGNTLGNIAKEKAGIVRRGYPVVLGEGRNFLINAVKAFQPSKIYIFGRDFDVRKKGDFAEYHGLASSFSFSIPRFFPSILLKDFGIAVFCAELLGVKVTPVLCGDILAEMEFPGRCEIVASSPMVIMDGGHNIEAVKNVVKFLTKEIKLKEICALLAFMKDKKPEKLLSIFKKICKIMFFTKLPCERSWNPCEFASWGDKIFETPVDGLKYSLKTAKEYGLPLFIGGSFYLVGPLRKYIKS